MKHKGRCDFSKEILDLATLCISFFRSIIQEIKYECWSVVSSDLARDIQTGWIISLVFRCNFLHCRSYKTPTKILISQRILLTIKLAINNLRWQLKHTLIIITDSLRKMTRVILNLKWTLIYTTWNQLQLIFKM